MRETIKNIPLPVDGERREFRLSKYDAFSGVSLLRLVLKYLPEQGERRLDAVFTSLTEEELRTVMTTALSHTEVLLPAGYQPVMSGGDWGWEPLERDAPACLRLTVESVVWSLSGFFEGAGPTSPSVPPAA